MEALQAIRSLRDARDAATPRSALAVYLSYTLNPEEIFASSYAQWVAERSRERTLLEQVAAQRALTGPVNPLLQWNEAGSHAITDALDRLMEQLGWMRRSGSN